MSETFPLRVHRALANPPLEQALGHASAQLRSRRALAFASLPQADAVRDEARRARLATLHDLPEQLERFEARLRTNGVTVMWAATADAACEAVIDIAARHQVRRIAKAKSMVSEEIHLNRALAAAGLDVVETDLGEYIVQLADDRPSHIVAPIIHMTRADVGRVMHERLGIPLSDDPVVLARHARRTLREVFLDADMGITGANFGVAETGTLCLVTNEGNGRMVTTLPRVHVALMGIEKVVPTLGDLDRLLQLLPRSATGQKLTAYTTLLNGPRRDGDECGPEHMYVVLVDNGRSGIYDSTSAEILGCIRCGACMNVCPVYTTIGGHAYGDTYPGPVGAVVTPGLHGLAGWSELSQASSLCGACRDICPVRLDIPRMLLDLRNRTPRRAHPRWVRQAMRTFAAIVARPRAYRLAARIARFALRRQARNGFIDRAPGPARAWTAHRHLRAPATRTFQDQWRARRRDARSEPSS